MRKSWVNEDTDVAIQGIRINNVDSVTNNIVVNLSVTNGTLKANAGVTRGVAAGNITNNGTSAIALTGILSEIKATFADANGLIYRGNLDFNNAVNDNMPVIIAEAWLILPPNNLGDFLAQTLQERAGIAITSGCSNEPIASLCDSFPTPNLDIGDSLYLRPILYEAATNNDRSGDLGVEAQVETQSEISRLSICGTEGTELSRGCCQGKRI